MLSRFKLVLGWKGTKYCGWAKNTGLGTDESIQYRLEVIILLF